MMLQNMSLNPAAESPGGLREHSASISRLRRIFPRDYPTHTASRPAMTIPPTAFVLRH